VARQIDRLDARMPRRDHLGQTFASTTHGECRFGVGYRPGNGALSTSKAEAKAGRDRRTYEPVEFAVRFHHRLVFMGFAPVAYSAKPATP